MWDNHGPSCDLPPRHVHSTEKEVAYILGWMPGEGTVRSYEETDVSAGEGSNANTEE